MANVIQYNLHLTFIRINYWFTLALSTCNCRIYDGACNLPFGFWSFRAWYTEAAALPRSIAQHELMACTATCLVLNARGHTNHLGRVSGNQLPALELITIGGCGWHTSAFSPCRLAFLAGKCCFRTAIPASADRSRGKYFIELKEWGGSRPGP